MYIFLGTEHHSGTVLVLDSGTVLVLDSGTVLILDSGTVLIIGTGTVLILGTGTVPIPLTLVLFQSVLLNNLSNTKAINITETLNNMICSAVPIF